MSAVEGPQPRPGSCALRVQPVLPSHPRVKGLGFVASGSALQNPQRSNIGSEKDSDQKVWEQRSFNTGYLLGSQHSKPNTAAVV